METALTVVLIVIAPIVLTMVILRFVLYFVVVIPATQNRDVRFWINAILGGTRGADIKQYLASLSSAKKAIWKNRYLAYSPYAIGFLIVVWISLLLVARSNAF